VENSGKIFLKAQVRAGKHRRRKKLHAAQGQGQSEWKDGIGGKGGSRNKWVKSNGILNTLFIRNYKSYYNGKYQYYIDI